MPNTPNQYKIITLTPQHPLWPSLVAHLRACQQARGVLNDADMPIEDDLIFLAAVIDEKVVGNLALLKQPLMTPSTEWASDRDRRVRDENGTPQFEAFVETFFVDEAYRRIGCGRALQEEALRQTAALGCVQMRSWSSLDKHANYQLKLKMGFGFHPEIQQTPTGLRISGGYFVKRVD